ncbi:hypothetical protein LCGC14_1387940 [marine sediment metagenome]|uniref:Uncharacterized protein n=1 Tax=marine sediment metagenome TaxID=412755 RepID=A0A0F9K0Z2_9ZZZZ
MTKKICDKCFKEIKSKDDYFKVITYMKGEEVLEKFMHKICHESTNEENKKQLQQALQPIMNMSRGLLRTLGIKQPKEVYDIK